MVAIIDYGVGNLSSIKNMLKRVGADSIISDKPEDILAAHKLILPGVGAFDTCVEKLRSSDLISVLEQQVLQKRTPILGLCVGMQLLLEGSEEGKLSGLGWIKGRNIKFKQSEMPAGYKIPHMGWTDVMPSKSSKLLEDIPDPRFYFVHSYHAQLDNLKDGSITANYGYQFFAGIERENILGVQFHPEKSHKFGMKLFENFVKNY